jgi:hypothetical protein
MVILRNDSDAFEKTVYGNVEDIDCEIIERVTKIAKQKISHKPKSPLRGYYINQALLPRLLVQPR